MTKKEKDDFDLFRNECEKWAKILGLSDWEIKYIPAEPSLEDELNEARYKAWVTFDSEACLACVYYNIKWREVEDKNYKDIDIPLSAFHEMCEILVADIMRLTFSRYNVCEEDIIVAKHKLIHKLENCLFRR